MEKKNRGLGMADRTKGELRDLGEQEQEQISQRISKHRSFPFPLPIPFLLPLAPQKRFSPISITGKFKSLSTYIFVGMVSFLALVKVGARHNTKR